MKAYTDLEQSKKLAEILPLESADMYYQYALPKSDKIRYNPILGNPIESLEWYNKGYTHFGKKPLTLNEYCIPCWSLSALLKLFTAPLLQQDIGGKWLIKDWTGAFPKTEKWYDNPIDACYEMILNLYEQNLI